MKNLTAGFGEKQTDMLMKVFPDLDRSQFADALIAVMGTGPFQDKEFRRECPEVFTDREIEELCRQKINRTEFFSFKWGDNRKTKLFLKLFGVDVDSIESRSVGKDRFDLVAALDQCILPRDSILLLFAVFIWDFGEGCGGFSDQHGTVRGFL